MGEYRPNSDGFRQMVVSPEIRAALRQVADKAQRIAEGIAEDFRITGDYERSFEVREETKTIAGHRRAVAQLVNTSDHALAVEWGNEHTPHPHRVLARTLDRLNG